MSRIPVVAALLVVTPAAASAQTVAELRAKAEQGDVAAQKSLADSLFGRDDETNGITWLRKSAEAGYAKAQNDLGTRYSLGRGVPKDLEQARAWYRKATAQGFATAAANLCHWYEAPLQLLKGTDPVEAWPMPPVMGARPELLELFDSCRNGATTGAPYATQLLGVLYARGIGDVKPDYEQAYFWLRVRSGPRDLRRKLVELLGPEKRVAVDERARAWKPTTPFGQG